MTSKTQGYLKEGLILAVYKPGRLTSHDIIDQLRKVTGIRRIGHAGTLDPLAQGVLVVGIGRAATKQLGKFLTADKDYRAEITFGKSTDTYDAEGKVIDTSDCWQQLTQKQVEGGLKNFIGPIEQRPPPYSAKKVAGRKAYEIARGGEQPRLKPALVTINSIKLLDWQPPRLTIKVRCSSGTYIRSLADDLGKVLLCPAHLSALTRTRVGKFKIGDSIRLDELRR